MSPLEVEPRYVCPVGLGDIAEAVAEGADDHCQRLVSRRQHVHHSRLHRPGAGGSKHKYIVTGLEHLLEAHGHVAQYLAELLASMVDHLASHRLQDIVRTGGRSGYAQLYLFAVSFLSATRVYDYAEESPLAYLEHCTILHFHYRAGNLASAHLHRPLCHQSLDLCLALGQALYQQGSSDVQPVQPATNRVRRHSAFQYLFW